MVPKKGILTNVHNVDIISAMSEYQDNYISINNLPIISYLVLPPRADRIRI